MRLGLPIVIPMQIVSTQWKDMNVSVGLDTVGLVCLIHGPMDANVSVFDNCVYICLSMLVLEYLEVVDV